jgi:ribosomal protein S18 acetylase RimI-like enzyme
LKIEPLKELTPEDVRRLIVGYESIQRYEVRWEESKERTSFSLELVDLDEPFVRRWKHEHMTDWYRSLLVEELSFGARDRDRLVGLAITESRWNDEVMVWELHVDERSRGQGVGRRLLQAVEDAARDQDLRGIDLSFYGNDDLQRGEVAVFMKKAIA